MSPALLLSPGACLVAGLVTSLHCAGMCGPFFCAVVPASRERYPLLASVYHTCRIGAYMMLGAIGGGLGRLPLSLLPQGVLRLMPVLGVVLFIGLAFRWDRRWVRPTALTARALAFVRGRASRSPALLAGLVGGLTPLLPCGPLYFFIGIALLSGSASRGAELMLAFGLGTLPLLWLVQGQVARLRASVNPAWFGRLRFGLALGAAALAAWRARMVFPGGTGNGSWICF